jgi:hypothetical protein
MQGLQRFAELLFDRKRDGLLTRMAFAGPRLAAFYVVAVTGNSGISLLLHASDKVRNHSYSK